MELIISFIVVVLGIFAAALSRQLTDEFKAWTPWIIKHLVKGAVRRLAEEDRSRFEEEWLAHVNEIPGEVGKIIDALGFFYAAQRISLRISVPKRILDVLVCSTIFLLQIPVMLMIASLIKAGDGGPILIKREQKWNGQTVLLFKFRTEGLAGRRTRVGQFLLSSNLDQLPTLINILRGDMTMPSWKESYMAMPSLKESFRSIRRMLGPANHRPRR
jgi:hypothetical protein